MELMAVKDAGIRLYAIGVGNAINEFEIAKLSSHPSIKGTNYFIVEDIQSVSVLI